MNTSQLLNFQRANNRGFEVQVILIQPGQPLTDAQIAAQLDIN
jgi:hypothetical protein